MKSVLGKSPDYPAIPLPVRTKAQVSNQTQWTRPIMKLCFTCPYQLNLVTITEVLCVSDFYLCVFKDLFGNELRLGR